MPALVAGIHLLPAAWQDVDGWAFASPKRLRPRRRDKPGHDVVGDFLTRIISFFCINQRQLSLPPGPA